MGREEEGFWWWWLWGGGGEAYECIVWTWIGGVIEYMLGWEGMYGRGNHDWKGV